MNQVVAVTQRMQSRGNEEHKNECSPMMRPRFGGNQNVVDPRMEANTLRLQLAQLQRQFQNQDQQFKQFWNERNAEVQRHRAYEARVEQIFADKDVRFFLNWP